MNTPAPVTSLPPLVVDGTPLSQEERTAFDYCDATVEQTAAKAKGQWFEFTADLSTAPPKVVNAIRQTYEAQGFGVGVFPVVDALGALGGWRLIFAPPKRAQAGASRQLARELPALSTLPPMTNRPVFAFSPPMDRGCPRLLVRMPTRGRAAQAIHVLSAYRNMAGAPVQLEAVIDADDDSMMASDVLQRLRALDVIITVGASKSKIEAVNAGSVKDWDILLLASDDMMPVADGYAAHVIAAMTQHFPHYDGAIFFDDGYAHDRCCTLPIIGRRLYEQFGYVYEPSYRSLVCDIEQTNVFRGMGRLVYVDKKIIEHRHPAVGNASSDALYSRNNKPEQADRDNYAARSELRRPHAQIAFDAPPLWLSVCIATVPKRSAMLARLVDYLLDQIARDAPRKAEVITDAGPGTIGEKRQRLLERARGHFVAYVDDDDWIAHDYIAQIVSAVERVPTADCLSLWGVITENGDNPQRFHHSIQYDGWYRTADGLYARTPNHLNAVRRDIALQVGFEPKQFGEDHQYSKGIRPLLKTEVPIDSILYHYWFRGDK